MLSLQRWGSHYVHDTLKQFSSPISSSLITQTLLEPTEAGMPHQLHSGGTSLLSSSSDFSERYSF